MWRRRDDWRKELGDKLGVASSCRRLAFRHRQNDSIYVELNRVIEGGTDRLKARTYSLATERREGAWVTRAAGIRDALADLGWQESEGRDEYELPGPSGLSSPGGSSELRRVFRFGGLVESAP